MIQENRVARPSDDLSAKLLPQSPRRGTGWMSDVIHRQITRVFQLEGRER